TEAAQGRISDNGGADGADNAAHAMDAENVEAVVIFQHRLEGDDGPETDETGHGAEDDGAEGAGETGGRRDGHEAGNGARDEAQGRGMATGDLFADGPGDGRSGRSGDGVEEGLSGQTIGAECRTGVEAKP